MNGIRFCFLLLAAFVFTALGGCESIVTELPDDGSAAAQNDNSSTDLASESTATTSTNNKKACANLGPGAGYVYVDFDGDGHGNPEAAIVATPCEIAAWQEKNDQPNVRLATVAGDCDDANPAINPGATEACDGIDNDCNGKTDEGLTLKVFLDADQDGFGAGNGKVVCKDDVEAMQGYSIVGGDCNDVAADGNADGIVDGFFVNPEEVEVCGNGLDDNCDGQIDEDCSSESPAVDAVDPAATATIVTKEGDLVNLVFGAGNGVEFKVMVEYIPDGPAPKFDGWDVTGWVTTQFNAELTASSSVVGIRFNVQVGEKGPTWFCEGNGASAKLNYELVSIGRVLSSGLYVYDEELEIWSDPSGNGCSAVLYF